MPSGRKKNKWSARQAPPTPPPPRSPTSPTVSGPNPFASDIVTDKVHSNSSTATTIAALPSASSPTKPSHLLERAATSSSLVGADAEEEMGHSGGNNTNGTTSASPPPSHSSSATSDGGAGLRTAAAPAAPRFSVSESLLSTTQSSRHHDAAVAAAAAAAAVDEVLSATTVGSTVAHPTTSAVEPEEEQLMTAVEAAMESPGEIFYVQLDPDAQLVTGVLPEMEQLHVQLTKLRRVLRQSGAVLYQLRERAAAAGDDPCELYAAPPSQPRRRPSAQSHTSTVHNSARGTAPSPTSQLASARNDGRGPAVAAARTRPSPRFAPHMRTGSALSYSPVGAVPMYPRRHGGDGEHTNNKNINDEESEWCDAATINTSSASTTARSTPSLHPTLMPPPAFQLYEEDELDDDGRGSHRSSVTGVRRTYVARFRPDSVPSSIQSTPNMQPASVSYARSDGGGILCLPPSTSSMTRSESLPLRHPLQQQQLTQPLPSAPHALPSPTATSPGGSVMSRLENSPLLPPSTSSARRFDQRDLTSSSLASPAGPAEVASSGGGGNGGLNEVEKAELVRLSQRVAELYQRRGLLLQKADRILCQHAQQHERWEGNEERRGCYRCRRLFSHLTRRHHCRRCGRLCCAECSRYVGKKQDTSYVAPTHFGRVGGSGNGTGAAVAHRVIIKSEYTARMTADDAHVLAEESFDEHTYPRRGGNATTVVSPAASASTTLAATTTEVDEQQEQHQPQLHDVSYDDAASSPDNRAGRSRQHKWVRLCAPCYQNCLRARRNNVLQYLKNANLCILDDGFYYYHVMTKEELCQLSTALSKPDSFKKQMELMTHVVMERSVDYVAAAPGYSAQTIATAMQHTPDVLRTLGGISAYAFRSARQTANDYVGGYFAASRTILPDNPVGAAAAAALHAQSAERDADGLDGRRRHANDGDCSEASVESLDDTCSETQSPSTPGTDHNNEDAGDEAETEAETEEETEAETAALQEYVSAGEEEAET